MELNQTIINEMLEQIVPRLTLTRLVNAYSDISIVADKDSVLLVANGKNNWYISAPYEVENNGDRVKLHGNTRNKIAKEFVANNSIESILNLESEYIKMKQNEEKQFHLEQVEMNNIFKKDIFPLFENTNIKTKPEITVHWGNEPLIEFKCEYENPLNRWKDRYSNKIEIYFDNHSLNTFSILTGNKQGINERECGLTIEDVKDECRRVISECEEALTVYQSQFEEMKRLNEEENKINTFAFNACRSKDVTILRKKNSFVVISNGLKFATGTGKIGKYYKIYPSDVVDMISKKGYTEYYQEEKSVFTMRQDDELKTLPWSKLA